MFLAKLFLSYSIFDINIRKISIQDNKGRVFVFRDLGSKQTLWNSLPFSVVASKTMEEFKALI